MNLSNPTPTQPTSVAGICADCPFWDHLQASDAEANDTKPPMLAGACRKAAPLHVQELEAAKVPDTMISGIRPGIWPITRGNDWCGDHPLRAASYALGVEHLKGQIKEQERAMVKARRAAEVAARSGKVPN